MYSAYSLYHVPVTLVQHWVFVFGAYFAIEIILFIDDTIRHANSKSDCKEYLSYGGAEKHETGLCVTIRESYMSGRKTTCKTIFVSHRNSDEVVGDKLSPILARSTSYFRRC